MHCDSRSQTNAWLNHLLGRASEHDVVFLDADGRIVAWLGAAERIFGFRKAEALQLELADLFIADDLWTTSRQSTMRSQLTEMHATRPQTGLPTVGSGATPPVGSR